MYKTYPTIGKRKLLRYKIVLWYNKLCEKNIGNGCLKPIIQASKNLICYKLTHGYKKLRMKRKYMLNLTKCYSVVHKHAMKSWWNVEFRLYISHSSQKGKKKEKERKII